MGNTGKTTNPSRSSVKPKTQIKGLPKFGERPMPKKSLPKKTQSKKSYPKKFDGQERELNFVPLNTTNVKIIQDYFETIAPELYDILAKSEKYSLYQYEDVTREIFLIPENIAKIVKKLSKTVPIIHAAIHLGYMRRKRTHTGFERAFYLSYEGGEFIYHLILNKYRALKSNIQIIEIDGEGERAFLYGRELEMDCIINEVSHLVKKKLIFVLDRQKQYIGLALLRVRQAGIKPPSEENNKSVDDYSRSQNFSLSIMTLTDAGYYLRKGG